MAAADWSSLPADVVRRVADVFLATTDLDYYMSLRAACRPWCAATADPRGPDRRFHPRRWIMLDEAFRPGDAVGSGRLFLNLDTGRFLRKDLPMLRNYNYLATADGLLVLEDRTDSYDYYMRLCVLNPFTGSLVRFRVPHTKHLNRSVAVTGSSPMVLFSFYDFVHLAWADQTCVFWPPLYEPTPAFGMFAAVVAFQGRVYAANMSGSVAVVEISRRCKEPQTIIIVDDPCWDRVPTLLLDNGGELLLVRVPCMEVFRVDLVRKALVPVTSIGNRALILGLRCSLSVDADRLPAIDAGFIYYGQGLFAEPGICAHRLRDNRDPVVSGTDEQLIPHSGDVMRPIEPSRFCPRSLAHVLLSYCMGSGPLVYMCSLLLFSKTTSALAWA